jgi:hypothetical protein
MEDWVRNIYKSIDWLRDKPRKNGLIYMYFKPNDNSPYFYENWADLSEEQIIIDLLDEAGVIERGEFFNK